MSLSTVHDKRQRVHHPVLWQLYWSGIKGRQNNIDDKYSIDLMIYFMKKNAQGGEALQAAASDGLPPDTGGSIAKPGEPQTQMFRPRCSSSIRPDPDVQTQMFRPRCSRSIRPRLRSSDPDVLAASV